MKVVVVEGGVESATTISEAPAMITTAEGGVEASDEISEEPATTVTGEGKLKDSNFEVQSLILCAAETVVPASFLSSFTGWLSTSFHRIFTRKVHDIFYWLSLS